MLGLILRGALGGDSAGGGALALIIACCAIAGLYKCSQFRLRDCSCCRWWLRTTGSDAFDDFPLFVMIHEMAFVSQDPSLVTRVRLTAGDQQATTDKITGKFVGQALEMSIEQGAEVLTIDITDAYGSKVLASLDMNIVEDIIKAEDIRERTYPMHDKRKTLKHPRIKLTMRQANGYSDEETGILSQIGVSDGATGEMVRHHLQNVQHDLIASQPPAEGGDGDEAEGDPAQPPPRLSEGQLLAQACRGNLEKVGAWGAKDPVYVAVKGPPAVNKLCLGVWRSEKSFEKNEQETLMIDLLRVVSVQVHPSYDEAFVVNYVPSPNEKKQLTLLRVDRPREVWVETLSLLIKLARDKKEASKKGARKGKKN